MAKTSKIVKNNKRKKTIEVYAEKRQDLLKIVKDPNTSYEEKREAQSHDNHNDNAHDNCRVDCTRST